MNNDTDKRTAEAKKLADIIEAGCKYGANWLVMLREMKETASYYGIDLDVRANQIAVAAMALKALRIMEASK